MVDDGRDAALQPLLLKSAEKAVVLYFEELGAYVYEVGNSVVGHLNDRSVYVGVLDKLAIEVAQEGDEEVSHGTRLERLNERSDAHNGARIAEKLAVAVLTADPS